MTNISGVILTFNSEETIRHTLETASRVCSKIFVVDSFSSDRTMEIVSSFEAVTVVQRPFSDYASQRNWAIENLPVDTWQLHLDADEFLSNDLIQEIQRRFVDGKKIEVDGFYIPRLVRFMGRDIRHGGMYPIFHMRLFRTGKCIVERKKYDQHFVIAGKAEFIRAPMVDDIRLSVSEWTRRHDKWADFEIEDYVSGVNKKNNEDVYNVVRSKKMKGLYYSLPIFYRAFAIFFYRYIFRAGFLDGREGLIFFVLQTFWFRFYVDAKLYERHIAAN